MGGTPKFHSQVIHPNELLKKEETIVGQTNDWLASHLAILFGSVWTIWVFVIVPLISLALPTDIQSKIFFLASGWVQLFALPLFVWVGNKIQKSGDAQSDAMHQALTHIAIVEDQNNKLIELNNKLTAELHDIVVPGGKSSLKDK